jgi:hypothetical protein
VSIGWIVTVAIIVAAGVVVKTYWSGAGVGPSDLGSVSHEWLAEHRNSQVQDSRR